MKYYQLSIDDSEELWTKYKIFGIDFVIGSERVNSANLYSNSANTLPVIKTLVEGNNPDFSMVGTNDIIMRKKSFDRSQFSHPEISFVPIKDETTEEIYFLLKFMKSIECVNLKLSSYEMARRRSIDFFTQSYR